MTCETKLLEELRDRVIRTESRIVQLGDHVGANLRAKQKIEVILGFDKLGDPLAQRPRVRIDSMDVSVSRILAKLKEAGAPHQNVAVYCDGELVFILYPKEQ